MGIKTARAAFESRSRIIAAAWRIASEQIKCGPNTYLSVEDISLDDDPDHPTVVIMAAEKWQGNQEDTTIVVPLEEFAEVMDKC